MRACTHLLAQGEREGQTDGQTDRSKDGQTDGRTDGQTEREAGRLADSRQNKQTASEPNDTAAIAKPI